ncbi:ornithine cyclodeaminase [Neobacillus bataviensis LMG 21833]|uniref:Ornithine cyclodeaminase n=1 Tax=Neobacillus bataviensis LMG 21833 TaxID=1117379 RepID=K6BZB5_9BACI|nr:ornithine cyclodeaminase family protein [Neobacillus bataviensis]EKN64260.1 ornithine cyclodeaminase [Neobacillus bataviensis LMG 21833]
MLILSSSDLQNMLNMSEVIEAVSTGLEEYSASRTNTPLRTILPVTKSGGNAIFMPASAEEVGCLGMKYVSTFPNNRKIGKKVINGVVLFMDIETGEPVALLEASYLTVMRTGALSGAATKYLARPDSKVLSMIGTGEQALGQLQAILAVRDIEKVQINNRSKQKALEFAAHIERLFPVSVSVYENADEAIDGADIIVTSTSSNTPVFTSGAAPGVHINAIGSYQPTMRELPTCVISQAQKIVVESRDATVKEAGDLQIPIQEGKFSADRIHAELGEIISNRAAGRENESEVTIFKSVGFAAADIVVAKYFYEKALKEGIGQHVELGSAWSLDTIEA